MIRINIISKFMYYCQVFCSCSVHSIFPWVIHDTPVLCSYYLIRYLYLHKMYDRGRGDILESFVNSHRVLFRLEVRINKKLERGCGLCTELGSKFIFFIDAMYCIMYLYIELPTLLLLYWYLCTYYTYSSLSLLASFHCLSQLQKYFNSNTYY